MEKRMDPLYVQWFVWPSDRGETPAKTREAVEAVLNLVGGNPEHRNAYFIADEMEHPVDVLIGNGKFIIRLVDNIPFTWPRTKGTKYHGDNEVIREVLKMADMPPELYVYFFIAKERGGMSLEYTSNAYLRPGNEYFLRSV